ncbi:hypothetical protein AB0C02_32540 [Micromonospora sp. NPDC048999]|uniref:hypothetical protein n=1 Tax=Micromonospora sp. NPDC048999 TaxID=3155391 RepID=UPI0033D9ADA2
MTDLIATVGKKITERWLAAILLPGLLYVAVIGWAVLAGQRHALDLPWLANRLTGLWQQHTSSPGTAVVAIATLLAAAGLAGVAATAAAEDGVHRLWTIRGPQRWLDIRRRKTEARWQGREPQPPRRYLPERATAIGERFRLIGTRIEAQYGLSVTAAWPRIWILTDNDARTLIGTAHRRYYTDTALAAWGLLYLPWTIRWWPAVVIAIAALAVGYRRALASSAVLATLIEATVDAHTTGLAKTLGVDLPEGRLTPEEGNRINNILIKRA